MRNRFYRGTRPHHVDRFVVDLRAGTFDDVLDRIERGQADWGYVPRRRGFLLVTRAGPEVRSQPVALLRQAGRRPEGVPPERLAPAVPKQCGTAQGGQLRPRPAGDRAPGRSPQSPCRPTDRSVPAAGNPWIPGRAYLPGRRSGRSTGESPRTGAYTERQSRALDMECPGRACGCAGRQAQPEADRPRRRHQGTADPGLLPRGRRTRRECRHRARSLGTRLRRSLSVHQPALRWPLHRRGEPCAPQLAEVQRHDPTRSTPPR